MGEITEMILEGILCQICGVFMGEDEDEPFEAPGYPVTCKECKK